MSLVSDVAQAQRFKNRLVGEQLKLMDPTVQRALANVARRNFRHGMIAGCLIGLCSGVAGMVVARLIFKALGWV